jgi:CheY-like chemotaxis protein
MQGCADILIASAADATAIAIDLILTHDGHQTARVSSGSQALSHIRALRPKRVFVDTNLPEMSGLEVCQRLRNDPNVTDLSVVILTQDARAIFKRKALALGADAVLVVPIAADDIARTVTQFIAGGIDAN